MPLAPQITNTPIPYSTWFVSGDYDNSSTAVVTPSATYTVAYPGPSAVNIGDIWYDTSNGNLAYRWDGSNWVSVQDGSIASAATLAGTANTTANSALSTANTANTTANAALTSANGKNKVFYGSSTPTATSVGDLWFDGSNTNRPNQWNGSSWVPFGLGYLAVTSIDAGNITTGTLTSRAINNGSGTFTVDTGGAVNASNINATGGSIAGFTFNTSQIYAGPITSTILLLNSSTGNISGNNITSLGTTISTGNMTAQSYFYNSGYATTTSSANAYINSSTGLLARSSSSLRYKLDVQPQEIPVSSILQLAPKSFIDKAAAETQNGSTEGLPRILGLIAEEIATIPVLADLLMNKNEKGEPDSVNYDRVAIALIPLLKDLNTRLAAIEAKLSS